MGDRANIVIKADGEVFPHDVFFYTHWCGYNIRNVVQSALIKGRGRWSDPAYLARVIFCTLVEEDPDGITGYGLSTRIGDGDDNLLDVYMRDKRVRHRGKLWTFEEFVEDKNL
jgi:hypothetical protein